GVLLAVIGVLLWAPWVARNDPPLVRYTIDLGPNALPENSGSNISTIVVSPDGRRLVYHVGGPNGRQLGTRLLDQSTLTILAGTQGAFDPFFSPDGQWIGFFANGKLKRFPVQGGAPVELCDAPTEQGASWGRNDVIIAALGIVGGLSRIPAEGGTPELVTKPALGFSGTHRW